MSLLRQTALYLLVSAVLIAGIGAVGFYTLIHRTIRHEVDEILVAQSDHIEGQLRRLPPGTLPPADLDDNPHVERIAQTGSVSTRPQFSDVTVADTLENNEPVLMRQLRTTVSANGQPYRITIRQPYYEFNELARILSVGVILGFLGLTGLSVLAGLGLSRRLWRPFYRAIDQLNQFRLDQPADAHFPTSRVREFGLLSRALGELTQKLRRQFSLQKQFTENASHELQTPLAVASAELDQLLQSHHLTEPDYAHLQRATDALGRLSQINRSLLLLTQVENSQFADADVLNLSQLLSQYADEYEPFFVHKRMRIERRIAPDVAVRMNGQLAGVLLTNVLKNAVRHSEAGGCAGIRLTPDALTISNSGEPLPFADSQLFNRFVKNPARPDSTGLGLALVKQIADRYALPLTYRYDSPTRTHTFRLGLRT